MKKERRNKKSFNKRLILIVIVLILIVLLISLFIIYKNKTEISKKEQRGALATLGNFFSFKWLFMEGAPIVPPTCDEAGIIASIKSLENGEENCTLLGPEGSYDYKCVSEGEGVSINTANCQGQLSVILNGSLSEECNSKCGCTGNFGLQKRGAWIEESCHDDRLGHYCIPAHWEWIELTNAHGPLYSYSFSGGNGPLSLPAEGIIDLGEYSTANEIVLRLSYFLDDVRSPPDLSVCPAPHINNKIIDVKRIRYCGDGDVYRDGADGIAGTADDEECDPGKSCAYDYFETKKSCKSKDDCSGYSVNGNACDDCNVVDSGKCTASCKCGSSESILKCTEIDDPERPGNLTDALVRVKYTSPFDSSTGKCSLAPTSTEDTKSAVSCGFCRKCDAFKRDYNAALGDDKLIQFEKENKDPFTVDIKVDTGFRYSSKTPIITYSNIYSNDFGTLNAELINPADGIIKDGNNKFTFKITPNSCGISLVTISLRIATEPITTTTILAFIECNCADQLLKDFLYKLNQGNIQFPYCFEDEYKKMKVCKITDNVSPTISPKVNAKCNPKQKSFCIPFYNCVDNVCSLAATDIDYFYSILDISVSSKEKINTNHLACLGTVCEALKELDMLEKKRIGSISFVSLKGDEVAQVDSLGRMVLDISKPEGCTKGTIIHELTHTKTFSANPAANFLSEWKAIAESHDKPIYGDGFVATGSGSWWRWINNPSSQGPSHGIMRPYGASSELEDISEFVRFSITQDSIVAGLISGNSYGDVYRGKLDKLYEYKYINCEQYYTILEKAGIEF